MSWWESMCWWEVTTTSGRTFCVKGGSSFHSWCGAIRGSARQAAEDRLDDGESISSWFCKGPYMTVPPTPAYGGVRQ